MKFEKYLSQFPMQTGKTIVVTGANSGIGLQIAKHLAWLGANVILACRNEERAAAAMTYIRKRVPGAILEFARYDQASFSSLDDFVTQFHHRRLDAFVFNAGICGSNAALKTENGFPLIFGTNFVGAFYLTERCKEKFLQEHTRLVYVSSLAGWMAKEEPLLTFEGGGANRQYGYSKLCVAQYACELMEEGLEAVLVHPGVSGTSILFGKDTGMPKWVATPGRKLLARFPNKGEKPSLVSVRAVCGPYRKGLYLHPRSPFGLVGLPECSSMPEKFQRTKVGSDAWTMIQVTASKLK